MVSTPVKAAGAAVAVLGAAAAGWIGASHVMATKTEAAFRAYAARPGTETGMEITKLEHTTGLLSAKGSFQVKPVLTGAAIPPEDLPVGEVTYSLSHLLLPGSAARINWSVSPTGEIDKNLTEVLGKRLTLSGAGSVGYQGQIKTDYTLPEMKVNKDGESVTTAPAGGMVETDGKAARFTFTFPSAELRGKGEAIDVKGFSVTGDYSDIALGLGTGTVALEKLSSTEAQVEGLKYTAEALQNGDRLDIRIGTRLKKGAASGQTVSDAALDIHITGMDLAPLKRMSDLMEKSDFLQNITAEEDEAFRKDLRGVINNGFGISIPVLTGTLNGDQINGTVAGKMAVTIGKAPSATGPVSLTTLLSSSGEINVSSKNLPKEQVQMAVATGFAVATADGLKSEYSLKDAVLKVNNLPLAAEQVKMGLLTADETLNALLDQPLAESGLLGGGLYDDSEEYPDEGELEEETPPEPAVTPVPPKK